MMQRILGKEMQKETRTKTEKEMKAQLENDMKARRKNAKEKKKLTNKTTKKKPKKKPKKNTKKNTKKKEHKVERLPEDIAWDVYEMLNGKGVAVLPSIIDAELCAEIAADIHTRVMGVEQANFGVKGYWLRKDVGPSLNVGNVYSKLIGSLATLFADVLEAELGPDPELFELSNMVAYPGAAMQDPHSDVTAIDGTDEDLTDEERYNTIPPAFRPTPRTPQWGCVLFSKTVALCREGSQLLSMKQRWQAIPYLC